LQRPEDVNDPEVVRDLQSLQPDALVVIAFGQKLGQPLLDGIHAFNLHASLLPAYRGAAPINRAMMDGLDETGVSVIGLASRMDAGPVHAQASTRIRSDETAGELHDRLAEMGPELLEATLAQLAGGTLDPRDQDEAAATQAPKLSRDEATVHFDQPADMVRARVHGLTPWPGCDVLLGGERLRILRVAEAGELDRPVEAGTLLDDGSIACVDGRIRLLEVQPAGGRPMDFTAYRNGRSLEPGMRAEGLS